MPGWRSDPKRRPLSLPANNEAFHHLSPSRMPPARWFRVCVLSEERWAPTSPDLTAVGASHSVRSPPGRSQPASAHRSRLEVAAPTDGPLMMHWPSWMLSDQSATRPVEDESGIEPDRRRWSSAASRRGERDSWVLGRGYVDPDSAAHPRPATILVLVNVPLDPFGDENDATGSGKHCPQPNVFQPSSAPRPGRGFGRRCWSWDEIVSVQ
jgi:hypothetical protein